MHVIEGLMITRPPGNTMLHASICVSPWGVFVQAMYVFSSSSEGGHPASILLPCGASPFRLSPAHSLPFIPPPPWGSSETGCQQLFSQHPGPFHTTGIMPSLHLIKVTPAYLYSCPSLAPLDLLSNASVTAAHTRANSKKKKKKSSCGKHDSKSQLFQKADVAQQWA